jgi:hypothetical protein
VKAGGRHGIGAIAGQMTPEGYYSIESLIKGLVAKKSLVGL